MYLSMNAAAGAHAFDAATTQAARREFHQALDRAVSEYLARARHGHHLVRPFIEGRGQTARAYGASPVEAIDQACRDFEQTHALLAGSWVQTGGHVLPDDADAQATQQMRAALPALKDELGIDEDGGMRLELDDLGLEAVPGQPLTFVVGYSDVLPSNRPIFIINEAE